MARPRLYDNKVMGTDITTRVPASLRDSLKARAAEMGISVAHLVRGFLIEKLDQLEGKKNEQTG